MFKHVKQCCVSKTACKVHEVLKFHLHLQKEYSTVTEVEDASSDTSHEQYIKTSLSSEVIALGVSRLQADESCNSQNYMLSPDIVF